MTEISIRQDEKYTYLTIDNVRYKVFFQDVSETHSAGNSRAFVRAVLEGYEE